MNDTASEMFTWPVGDTPVRDFRLFGDKLPHFLAQVDARFAEAQRYPDREPTDAELDAIEAEFAKPAPTLRSQLARRIEDRGLDWMLAAIRWLRRYDH